MAKPKPMTEQEVIFAGFWTRLMAHNIDLVILLPLFYLLSLFISSNELLYPICGALILVYEMGFIASSWSATPGKRIMKIKVTNSSFHSLPWYQSVARTLVKVLSIATLFIGYAVMVFHPNKQGLHDLIVHSVVIFQPLP